MGDDVDSSVERWRHFSELASDFAFTLELDADGIPSLQWASGAFVHALGYEPAEVAGLGGPWALVHPDDAELVRVRTEDLRAGRPRDDLIRLVTRGGETRWFLLRGRPQVDPDTGAVRFVHGVGTDVTDLKRSEERFAEISELTSDAAYVARIDPRTMRLTLEWCSDAYTRMFEARPDQVDSGFGWTRLVHEEDRPRAARVWEDVLACRPFEVDFRVAREFAGGAASKWLRAAGRSEPNPDGSLRVLGTLRDITDEKRAADLNAHLAAVVESTQDAVFTRDRHGRIVAWNHGAERLFGYAAAEVLGRTVDFLVPLGHRVDANRIFLDCLAGQPTSQFATQRVRADRALLDVSLTTSPVRNDAGEITHVATIARDVTAQHRAHQALVESELLLRESQQIARVGSWRWDAVGGAVTWTDELFSLLDIEPASITPRLEVLLERIHPEDRPRFASELERLVDEHHGFQARFRVMSPAGKVRWLVSRTQCLVDESGTLLGAVGTAQDVTGLVTAEQALRESELRFRSLVEHTPYGILLHQDGRVVYANVAAAWICGVPGPDDVIGKHTRDLVGPAVWPDVRQHLEDLAVCGPSGVVSEIPARRPDGSRFHLTIRSVPIQYEGQLAGLSVIEDVTERHEAEEALVAAYEHEREAAERLRETERMKERFLSGISHELRTPLTPIMGFAEALLAHRHDLDDAALDEMLDGVLRNARELASMVERVLDVIQLGGGTVSIDASTVALRDAMLTAVKAEVHTVTSHWWEFDVADVAVIADPHGLQAVLRNLIANALKYSREGSTVSIRARAEGNDVVVEVSDQGTGISQDVRARMFDAFEQGTDQPPGHRGVGVGLFLARSYVALMHGRLWIEDRPGPGSTVALALPLAAQTREVAATAAKVRTNAGTPQG